MCASAQAVWFCYLPANATAVGVPAEIVRVNNIRCCPADDLDQQDLPDMQQQRISQLEAA